MKVERQNQTKLADTGSGAIILICYITGKVYIFWGNFFEKYAAGWGQPAFAVTG
jgi:hypothetical protein